MAKLKNKKLNQFVVTNDLKVTLENIIVSDGLDKSDRNNLFECSVYVDGEYAFEVYNDTNNNFKYEIIQPDLFREVINFIDNNLRLIEDNTNGLYAPANYPVITKQGSKKKYSYRDSSPCFKVLENIINKELGLV